MKKKDDIQRKEISSKNIADDELSSLKAQINDMQLEIDLLKETISVLKKARLPLPLARMDTENGRIWS